MKANELRIGNWVHSGLTDTDFIIDAHDIRNISAGFDNGKTQPILLTEEWLLKFGFEFNNLNETYFFEKFSFRLYLRENELYHNWMGGNVFIKHVHQLQNLYFALTGEELKIKQQ